MKNMSFAWTGEQFLRRQKTVTRRDGWRNIKIGERHQGVRKAMGLKPGEKIESLGIFIPISSRWEPLQRLLDEPGYGAEEMVKEGFAGIHPSAYVEMMCKKYKCTPQKEFNRIEFFHILTPNDSTERLHGR